MGIPERTDRAIISKRGTERKKGIIPSAEERARYGRPRIRIIRIERITPSGARTPRREQQLVFVKAAARSLEERAERSESSE
jgi:hypothetical protein